MFALFKQPEVIHIFAVGFLLSISLCLDIGIVNVAIIDAGTERGFLPALLVGLGSCLGDLFYGALSISGLVVLLRLPCIRTIIWAGGNCLLIGMIVSIVRSTLLADRVRNRSTGLRESRRIGHIGKGILLSVASPSSILWFTTVGSVAVVSLWHGSPSLPIVFLAGFLCAGVTWSLFLAAASASSARLLGKSITVGARFLSAAVLSGLCLYSLFVGLKEIL